MSGSLVESLTASIGVIQRRYDEQLMAHFTDGDPTRSRRIKIFFTYRSTQRVLTHWRHYLSALMGGGIGRFADMQFEEGLAPGIFSRRDKLFSLDEPLNTPRARQYHSYLTTDLLIGPHGADLHHSAYVKPSAVVTELTHGFYETYNSDFKGGFFSSFAYGKHVGYFRAMIGHKTVHQQEHRDAWEGDHHTYMSLPDLRHTISVNVCGWLSMNSVRLADEARDLNVSADYGHLVPWWCRGGPKSVVRKALSQLRSRYLIGDSEPKYPSSREDLGRALWMLQPKQLAEQTEFYTGRATESGFTFDVPVCPPLEPQVGWALAKVPTALSSEAPGSASPSISSEGSNASLPHASSTAPPAPIAASNIRLALSPTELTRGHLNKLQNDCARIVTNVPLGDDYLHWRRRLAESMQSLLESVLMLPERKAQLVARMMVDGAAAVSGSVGNLNLIRSLLSGQSTCGAFPLDDGDEGYKCMSWMLQALLGNIVKNSNDEPEVSDGFLTMLASDDLTTLVANETLRAELASYVVTQMAVPLIKVSRDTSQAQLETGEFGYGWHCDDQAAREYEAKLKAVRPAEEILAKYFDKLDDAVAETTK
eukprot:GILJ01020552.1.p1 GENE.GILJ01020552.1~~GILJ01020552.1.p1  ORF type:complete len:670 (-),score=71.16 GILJ01020552.1:112-1890(-)